MAFQFGSTQQPNGNNSFTFGQPVAPQPSQPFSFGTAQPNTGFSFGTTATPAATSTFGFGATPAATTTAAPPAFGFSASTAPTFGTVANTSSGGLSFGASTPSLFGTTTTTPSFGGNLGSFSSPAQPTFGFGGTATPAVATVAPSMPTFAGFGSTFTQAAAAPTPGFGDQPTPFGTPFAAPAPALTTPSTAPFGSSTPQFGANPMFSTPAAPATQFAAPPPPFGAQPSSMGVLPTYSQTVAAPPPPAFGASQFGTSTVAPPAVATSTAQQPPLGQYFGVTTTTTSLGGTTAPANNMFAFSTPAASIAPTLNFGTTTTPSSTLASSLGGGVPIATSSLSFNPPTSTPALSFGQQPAKISATTSSAFNSTPSLSLSSQPNLVAITTVPTTTVAKPNFVAPTQAALPRVTAAPLTTLGGAVSFTGPPVATSLKEAVTTVSMTTIAPPSFGIGTTSTLAMTSTGASTLATTLAMTTPVTASTPIVATPNMTFRQLEESINKWNLELSEQERIFLNQATQVNAWDRLMINNGEKITNLNESVERIKTDQQHLDHELDFILAQQRELEELLVPLEKSVEATPTLSVQQHADLEREHTYHMAENVDGQLKRMAEDIKKIIDHLNTANKNQDENDPMHQISKILNAHMDALQWIDQNTETLQKKLDDISKVFEVTRKDNERPSRNAFD